MRHGKPTGPTVPARPEPPAGVLQTARSIAAVQRPDGAIPWPDGHVDPWDHVECAMALSACGLTAPARLAYQWLRDTQRPDGSWPRATGGPGAASPAQVTDHAAESHHAAYVAVGAWHEYLVTGDESHALAMWPTVRRAVEWTLRLRTPPSAPTTGCSSGTSCASPHSPGCRRRRSTRSSARASSSTR